MTQTSSESQMTIAHYMHAQVRKSCESENKVMQPIAYTYDVVLELLFMNTNFRYRFKMS